ncbi:MULTISPECIES: hypothetical protein [Rhodococcus]|uniref:Lipoprotein n=2 Tax=Rhodococcus erythropolis group TaxID=2840174 RepID=A0AAW6M056_RHOSG|nr:MULTISPECIES: hypothetical protein [Rhodococcus]MDE8649943.1 hypothetical protein [Rhodococcus qingshengii]
MQSRRRFSAAAAIFCAAVLVSAACSNDSTRGQAVAADAASTSTTKTTARDVSAPSRPSTTTKAPGVSNSGPTAPEVVEQGWSLVADGDFVTYGIRVHNPGSAVAFSEVTVTALDASGTPLETKQETVAFLAAGADAYVGGMLIDSSAIADLKVTTDPGRSPSRSDPQVTVTAEAKLLGTGYDTRVALTAQSDSATTLKSPQRIFYVFRDAGGEIVGGMFGFTQSAIPPNGTINEATPVTGFAPATATSVEVTVSAF